LQKQAIGFQQKKDCRFLSNPFGMCLAECVKELLLVVCVKIDNNFA